MKIGLMAVDSKYPNLALMKISAYHKKLGNEVEWYNPIEHYDIVYQSKIFTFTDDYRYPINADSVRKGGSGYFLDEDLHPSIDFMSPDYSIYPQISKSTAYGFITRGCPNKCKWCIVPVKEGNIHPYMNVEDIAVDGRTNLILMDNNILASRFGLTQIRKIVKNNYRVDFNQGLDARLVSRDIAELLASVRWIRLIRLGCDTEAQIAQCENAMRLIDRFRKNPACYLLYTIITDDINECYERISHFRGNKNVRVFAQPYRDPYRNNVIPQWKKDMARWANRRELFFSVDFKEFSPRKGFTCKSYFDYDR